MSAIIYGKGAFFVSIFQNMPYTASAYVTELLTTTEMEEYVINNKN